ncbi:peptidase S24 [Moraxella sp. FZFQ2102]|uniref:helix-turn-helix domain-containing protein n=1 Tax=Moraxella sp. FZFQ2102 TaxID=2953752 RepID=UPI00209BDBA8|nr:S24 family peptidase [Moraxella sp. FZFQ2102]USZ14662.1 peptidase S24 [Moraxella sp. FZFQ2102]
MSDLVSRMQQALDHSGLSWSKAAIEAGKSAQAASKWKKGQIGKDTLEQFAQVTGVNVGWLLTGQGSMTADTPPQADKSDILNDLKAQIAALQTGGILTDEQAHEIVDTVRVAMPANDVPLISWVAAGSWSEVSPVTLDDALGYYPRPRNLSADGFALKVRGRSMWPEFRPDDIIYVEPNISTLALKDGDLIVVQCNDDTEATFKQLVLGETESDMYLKPLNPDWPEQKMLPMGECRLVGKVVGKLVEY